MSLRLLDECVTALYRLAKISKDKPAFPSHVARRILGAKSLVYLPGMLAMGRLSMANDRHVIAIRRGLPFPIEEHTIGHELGHWILQREGLSPLDVEGACDYIGAAIQAPRDLFARVAHLSIRELARDFSITETSAALRVGEVTGRPVAVVAPERLRTRGEAFDWPPEESLRRSSRRAQLPGLAKTRIFDAARRFALMAI